MGKETKKKLTGMEMDAPALIYLHEQFKKNNTGSKKLKNNWVWYERKDLQRLIEMIDEIGGDGVRLYYGIYNKKVCDLLTAISKPHRDYADHEGHNTVFFVRTTKGTAENEHIDDISTETVTKYREAYKIDADLPKPFLPGFNVGHICPPPISPERDCSKSGSHL